LAISEIRAEVKKPKAEGATAEPEIAAASTALLAFLTSAGFSSTQQDFDGILNASLAMTAACKKYGYLVACYPIEIQFKRKPGGLRLLEFADILPTKSQ
jgi:hypothetical protein